MLCLIYYYSGSSDSFSPSVHLTYSLCSADRHTARPRSLQEAVDDTAALESSKIWERESRNDETVQRKSRSRCAVAMITRSVCI